MYTIENDAHSDPEPSALTNFDTITKNTVLNVINSTPLKSRSLDPWLAFLLFECIGLLIDPTINIINFSLHEGVFPQQFKHVIVTPLLKKPSLCKEQLSNYKVVSNLLICLLLKPVVAMQLNQHLKTNGLVNHLQSAYKTGLSTESALLKVTNDIHYRFAKR